MNAITAWTGGIRRLIVIVAGFVTLTGAAYAQAELPSQISVRATGLFTNRSDSGGQSHDATTSGGFLLGYSYQWNDWFGAEGNYGYSKNTQHFFSPLTCGIVGRCLGVLGQTGIQSNIHELTGSLVIHIPTRSRIQPYVLAGSGVLIFDPTDAGAAIGGAKQSRATFLYGGGVTLDITDRVGIRGEYRGLAYKTPDFQADALTVDTITHVAQPTLGIFFRF